MEIKPQMIIDNQNKSSFHIRVCNYRGNIRGVRVSPGGPGFTEGVQVSVTDRIKEGGGFCDTCGSFKED